MSFALFGSPWSSGIAHTFQDGAGGVVVGGGGSVVGGGSACADCDPFGAVIAMPATSATTITPTVDNRAARRRRPRLFAATLGIPDMVVLSWMSPVAISRPCKARGTR